MFQKTIIDPYPLNNGAMDYTSGYFVIRDKNFFMNDNKISGEAFIAMYDHIINYLEFLDEKINRVEELLVSQMEKEGNKNDRRRD